MGGLHNDLWHTINDTEIFKKLKNMDDQIKGARRILECRPVCKPLSTRCELSLNNIF